MPFDANVAVGKLFFNVFHHLLTGCVCFFGSREHSPSDSVRKAIRQDPKRPTHFVSLRISEDVQKAAVKIQKARLNI